MPSDPVEELIALADAHRECSRAICHVADTRHSKQWHSNMDDCQRVHLIRPLVTALVAAREEIVELRSAARELVTKLDECSPSINGAYQIAAIHGMPQWSQGMPEYGTAKAALAALLAKEPTPRLTASDLRPYVRHSEGCSAGIDARYKCKCGLSELMAKEAK